MATRSLFGGLIFKTTEAVAKPTMLGHHGGDLCQHILKRILVAESDPGQHSDVITHLGLICDNAVELLRNEFKGDVLGHVRKLVLHRARVNRYALSLKSSRPISIRLISLVPAPIS
jgi:hypothetical protein